MRQTLLLAALLVACGSGRDAGTHGDGSTSSGGDGSLGTGGCQGLQCQVAACGTGGDTVVTGRVVAPNGKDPVPNAVVFVPQSGLPEFPVGASCDACGDLAGAVAVTQTQTDYGGHFTLGHVPSGKGIPIVIQLGHFRRVLTVDVTPCISNGLAADAGATGQRLPRHDGELSPDDSVPHIAVATGDYDQIECVLARMGLDKFDLYSDRDPGQPPPTVGTLGSLLSDKTKLLTYNVLVLNCTDNQYEALLTDANVRKNVADFVTAGGRLYATDWAYDALAQLPEFSPYVCFEPQSTGGAPMCGAIPQAEAADTRNPYSGLATVTEPNLAEWLTLFPGVIDGNKRVEVDYSFVAIDAVATNMKQYPTTTWVTGDTGAFGTKPLTVTFDYAGCGRVHYSTYNTEPNGVVPDGERWPNCKPDFSPQERILEYLVFEVAACVPPPT